MKRMIVLAIAITMLCTMVTPVWAEDNVAPAEPVQGTQAQYNPSIGAIIGDLIARPFLVSGAIVTTAVCIVTMPVTFITGVATPATRALVEAPWRFAASRRLGEWNSYVDNKPITVIDPNER